MKHLNLFSLLICLILFVSCNSPDGTDIKNISVLVFDNAGDPLPLYAVQVLDVNQGWLSKPIDWAEGTGFETARIYMSDDKPVILKFTAPGYLPAYTFLTDGFTAAGFEVKLKPMPIADNPNPVVIGNFNNFDARSGIEMLKPENKNWAADIDSDSDTLDYLITGYSLYALPGSEGDLILNNEAPTFDRNYISRITNGDKTSFKIEFDPGIFDFTKPKSGITFSHKGEKHISGVAEIYTRMIDEYYEYLASNIRHQNRGNDDRYEHDFSAYIADLDSLVHHFNHKDVEAASILTKLRFNGGLNISDDEIMRLFELLEPTSEVWMIDFTALTDAVNIIGFDAIIDDVSSIASGSPYESMRAEALYNLVRYYHDSGNEEEWHAKFFELVSNHPDYFRTAFAYQHYAPEQPITEGKPLPFNEYNRLDDKGIVRLDELKEPFLLIDFWASWCGPCISAMPKLHNLYDTYSDQGFGILSISLDQSPAHVESFRKEWGMPWHHGFEGYNSSRIMEMGVVGVPYYVLLGPDRTVITRNQELLRGEDFSEFLESKLYKNE
jgi:thiol-disulfide isomerase/thioredoxin